MATRTKTDADRDVGAWISGDVPALNARIARRAIKDVGICEMPPGSNRSGRIDEYMRAVGTPVPADPAARGFPWCAGGLAAWFEECGAAVPPHDAGSAEAWRQWAIREGTWSASPVIGAAVVYGTPAHADHVGCVVRVVPILLDVEANTSLGNGFEREGVACDVKAVAVSRVLGYVHPRAKAQTTTTAGEAVAA